MTFSVPIVVFLFKYTEDLFLSEMNYVVFWRLYISFVLCFILTERLSYCPSTLGGGMVMQRYLPVTPPPHTEDSNEMIQGFLKYIVQARINFWEFLMEVRKKENCSI